MGPGFDQTSDKPCQQFPAYKSFALQERYRGNKLEFHNFRHKIIVFKSQNLGVIQIEMPYRNSIL